MKPTAIVVAVALAAVGCSSASPATSVGDGGAPGWVSGIEPGDAAGPWVVAKDGATTESISPCPFKLGSFKPCGMRCQGRLDFDYPDGGGAWAICSEFATNCKGPSNVEASQQTAVSGCGATDYDPSDPAGGYGINITCVSSCP